MIHIFFYLSIVGSVSGGTLTDANCSAYDTTTSALALTPAATVCKDRYSLDACKGMYGAGTNPAVVANAVPSSRSVNCFQAPAGTFSTDVQTRATKDCPQYCGYCCLTDEYRCTNAPIPRINCNSITNSMCLSPLWREAIASDCPNMCGFCTLGGCIDAAPDCAQQPTICYTIPTFANVNCRRTCGLCSSSTTAATTTGSSAISTTCGNNNVNCANWVRNGFCTSTFYTTAQKMSYCGTSCGLCTGK